MGKKKIVVQVISSSDSDDTSDDERKKKKTKKKKEKKKSSKHQKLKNDSNLLYQSSYPESKDPPSIHQYLKNLKNESSFISKLTNRKAKQHPLNTGCPGVNLNLPHAFDSLNHRPPAEVHLQGTLVPVTKSSEVVPSRSYNRIPENVNEWVDDMMIAGLLNQENLTSPNIAYQLIRYYPVVIFNARGSKPGREATKIFETVRKELSVKKDVVVEIDLDNSRVGAKIYNDLILLTQMRGLPQIFLGETFIGGLNALKKLKKFKRVGPMLLEALGYTKWPCKLCEMEDQRSQYLKKNKHFRHKDHEFRSNLYHPAH